MEPIKTPSNEALEMQLQALKARVTMLETDVDHCRDMARIEHKRSLDLILQVSKKVSQINIAWWFTTIALIIHALGHILT